MIRMLAVNYSKLRDNMKECFDQIADEREIMIVTRKDENMVIMSQSTYDSLMETAYLIGNQHNYQHLMSGVEQHKNMKLKQREIQEVVDD